MQVFGEAHNLSTTVTTYTLAILNAASILGERTLSTTVTARSIVTESFENEHNRLRRRTYHAK